MRALIQSAALAREQAGCLVFAPGGQTETVAVQFAEALAKWPAPLVGVGELLCPLLPSSPSRGQSHDLS